jgi:ATP-dependent Clp protease protease subunit
VSEATPLTAREELEQAKLQAEIAKLTAEARRWGFEAQRAQKEMEAWDAGSDEHRIYNYFGTVDAGGVHSAIDVIGNWTRRPTENKNLTVVLNSPGGSVIHGLALYDFLEGLKGEGWRITTIARGMAASMGGVLLQVGDERIIGKNANLLIHEVSTLGIGKLSEIEDEIKFTKKLQERLLDILASRSTMTKEQIKNKWRRKDWWLGSEETLELGFADRIG